MSKQLKLRKWQFARNGVPAEPEKYPEIAKGRFKRLFDFLRSGKMIVRVLPSEKFGLIHGKAGVITLDNGKKTAFLEV